MIYGQWGTVCDDMWSIEDGHVICRELGYLAAIVVTTAASFGAGDGEIWLDNVMCSGNETSIADCTSNGFGSHNCNHNEDAGVRCLAGLEFIIPRMSSILRYTSVWDCLFYHLQAKTY